MSNTDTCSLCGQRMALGYLSHRAMCLGTGDEIPYRDNVTELLHKDRAWSEYPLGTKAHAYNGGAWLRVDRGWKWNGHLAKGAGDTFPTPGADAFGKCVELPTVIQKERS